MTRSEERDDVLWTELGDLFRRTDPVPTAVLGALHRSLGWRDPDAAFAELIESAELTAGAVRADGGPQLLTFVCDELTIEVEVDVDGAALRLVGQLIPPQAATVVVDHPGGVKAVDADHLGRFIAGDILPGPARISCIPLEPPDARTVRTTWTVL